MKSIIIATTIIVGLLPLTAVQSQYVDHSRDWVPVNTARGCVYFNQKQNADVNATSGWVEDWAPGCVPGKPINGTGTMRSHNARGTHREDRSGTFVNGYWNGPVTLHATYLQDGAWLNDDNDGLVSKYVMGCLDFQVPDDCTPANELG